MLLAAHGERRAGATNAGVTHLAAKLRGHGLDVAVGFVNSTPSIAGGLAALGERDVVVYPLFLSDGYFTRIRLPQLLEQAVRPGRRTVRILPPLGLDPGLPALIVDHLAGVARSRDLVPQSLGVILLAHGSTKDAASRACAEQIAAAVHGRASFRDVRVALLEEPPSLSEAAADLAAPIIVLGLFAGEGLHGAADAPQLVDALGRDAAYAGTVGVLEGLDDVVAAAVARA